MSLRGPFPCCPTTGTRKSSFWVCSGRGLTRSEGALAVTGTSEPGGEVGEASAENLPKFDDVGILSSVNLSSD